MKDENQKLVDLKRGRRRLRRVVRLYGALPKTTERK